MLAGLRNLRSNFLINGHSDHLKIICYCWLPIKREENVTIKHFAVYCVQLYCDGLIQLNLKNQEKVFHKITIMDRKLWLTVC